MLKFEIKIIASLLFLFVTLVYFSSCATLTGYQDGRTVGEGNGEAMISLNISQSPEFSVIEDSFDNEFIPRFIFPNIEVGGRYGVGEKLDLTLKVNTNLNLGVGAKYQILGDRTSDFAMAVGGEVGTFGLVSGIWNAQIPVYLSYHPSEKVALYASPRYILQFSTIGDIGGWQYVGGNVGALFGSRHKFGIDLGLYSVGANGLNRVKLITAGIGGKFVFGNNMADSPKSGPKKKKKKQL
jgi:hypothetical protein